MNDNPDTAPTAPLAEAIPWTQVWITALTCPSVAAYEMLAKQPDPTGQRAHHWIFTTSFYGALIPLLSQIVMGGIVFHPQHCITIQCGGPTALVFPLVAFVTVIAATQLLAITLGGTGTYSRLAFACASFYAPLLLAMNVVFVIDRNSFIIGSMLAIAIAIYTSVLTVIAVRAVHQFGWIRSVITSSIVIGIQTFFMWFSISRLDMVDGL